MSWTCDGLKPQRKERWDDCERVNMGRWEQGRAKLLGSDCLGISQDGPDNRYNRTWRMPTIATTPSSLSEIRTFKTVSSTLADSLDRYFNPFLAPPDPVTPH
ncbi:hypothetical protein QTP88_018351 [Uroleucon formosanum]